MASGMDASARAVAERVFDREVQDEEVANLVPNKPDWRHRCKIRAEKLFDRVRVVLEGEIIAPDGGDAGLFERFFERDADGQRIIYHSFFTVSGDYAGNHLADHVVERAFPRYKDEGFQEVRTKASWVGRWVWAKYGFDWANEAERQLKLTEFMMFLAAAGMPWRQAELMAEFPTRSAPDLARFVNYDDVEIGRIFLLDDQTTAWHGIRRL